MATTGVCKVLIVILALILTMGTQLTEQVMPPFPQNTATLPRPPTEPTTTTTPQMTTATTTNNSHQQHNQLLPASQLQLPSPTDTTTTTTPQMTTTTSEPTTTTSVPTLGTPFWTDESTIFSEPYENATTTMNTTNILPECLLTDCVRTNMICNETTLQCECDVNYVDAPAGCIYDCGDAPNITIDGLPLFYVVISEVLVGVAPVGSIALYTCPVSSVKNYTMISGDYIICEEGGWNSFRPNCAPDCGTFPSPIEFSNTSSDSSITTFNATVNITCIDGYVPNISVSRCLATGNWENYTCSKKDCGQLIPPAFGKVILPDGSKYSSRAKYTCNNGYVLVGDKSRVCQATGKWSNVVPTCALADCGTPDAPSNGNVKLDGTTYTFIAQFSCEQGYNLIGNHSTECLYNGSWSLSTTQCTPIDCGTLGNPGNGIIDLSNGTIFRSSVTYSCNEDYNLVGNMRRTCLHTAKWDNGVPSCVRKKEEIKTCPSNTDTRGTTWVEVVAGNTRVKLCNQGYTGNITRECRSDGEWKLPQYNCVREQIQNIVAQVVALDENATEDSIEQAIDEITSITESAVEENVTDETKLTDGELKILSSSLEKVGELLNSNRYIVNEQITDSFISSADNLMDGKNLGSWKAVAQSNSSGAESLLKAVSLVSEAIGHTLNTTDKKTIVKKILALGIQKYDVLSDLVFPDEIETNEQDKEWVKYTNSQIKLEAESLKAFSTGDSTGGFITSAAIYKGISGILPTENTKSSKSAQVQNQINGPVVALTISPISTKDRVPNKFDPPISFTIGHEEKNLTAPICSFWQFKDVGQGSWSGAGCWVNKTNENFTICNCDHLTNFAVLMSPFAEVDSTSMALRIISIVGIGISICCILATFLIHLCLWSYMRNDRTTILMNLCVSLFFAYIVFLAGIERTESMVACAIIAGFLQYLYLVVFCVMLVEGIEIAITVMYVFKTKSRIKLLLIAAWVIPGIIVVVSAGVTQGDGYGNETYCWLSTENGLIWSFVGPALFIIVFNIICIILVIRAMCGTAAMETKKATEKVKVSVRSLCVLVPVMGISWLLGIFYVDDGFFFVQFIFTILNGLQGLFIFIFHVLFNHQVRKACALMERRRSSMKETLKSNFTIQPNARSEEVKLASPVASYGVGRERIRNYRESHIHKTMPPHADLRNNNNPQNIRY